MEQMGPGKGLGHSCAGGTAPADVSLSLFKKPSTEVNPKLPASVVVAFCTVPPVMAVQQCFGWHIRVNMHIYRGLIPCSLLYLTGSAMKCQLTAHILKSCVQKAVSCSSGCQKSELAFLTLFFASQFD